MRIYFVVYCLFLSYSSLAMAEHKIKIMALFYDKAMLNINGKQKFLKKGQSYQGVKLIQSDSDNAILLLHGEQHSYSLNSEISTSYKKIELQAVQVWADKRGMFRTSGSINDRAIKFLIDTGASTIALNSHDAKKLGLNYKKGKKIKVTTASSYAIGRMLSIKKVKVGNIVVHNVRAIVLNGSFPSEVLLGQSFLKRIQMERKGKKMILKENP